MPTLSSAQVVTLLKSFKHLTVLSYRQEDGGARVTSSSNIHFSLACSVVNETSPTVLQVKGYHEIIISISSRIIVKIIETKDSHESHF